MDVEVSRLKFQRELAALRDDSSVFLQHRKWELVSTEFPDLAVVFRHSKSDRRVGFRFRCDGWDGQPPSLSLFDPDKGAELSWDQWPQGSWSAADRHPVTSKPFLCLPGIREYHIHPSHLNDPWDNYRARDSYKLRYIIDRVQQKFEVSNG